MKNVMVTGGAGFIGVQLLKKLLSIKLDKIIVIDNLSNMNKRFNDILNSESNNKFSFYKADIRNKQETLDIIKDKQIDTCIHLGAIVSVLDSIVNPDYTIDVNINGTFNVLDACSRRGSRISFFHRLVLFTANPTNCPYLKMIPRHYLLMALARLQVKR